MVVLTRQGDNHTLTPPAKPADGRQKRVWRASIILATADGCGASDIMRRSGKSVVWRWQARFMTEGVAGLTRDYEYASIRAPDQRNANIQNRTPSPAPDEAGRGWR